MAAAIDTDEFSSTLRARGIDRGGRRVRITNVHGSQQESDLTEPANCRGLGRVRHFRLATSAGWPSNPLPIVPAIRSLGLDGSGGELRAEVFQNAVCNWRCWYCFVDFPLLAGNPKYSELVPASELVDLYLGLGEERPPMLDLSGGQPDLVPEWIAWTIEELRERGSSAYVWSDDNLSNDYFFRYLSLEERQTIEQDEFYGKVCCFKGFDETSFAFNTAAAPELFDRQFELMRRLVETTAVDLYAYATFTGVDDSRIEERMSAFVDRLQQIDRNLPLRTVPLEITVFSPVRSRMNDERERSLAVQQVAVAAWNEVLEDRFSRNERAQAICDVPLRA